MNDVPDVAAVALRPLLVITVDAGAVVDLGPMPAGGRRFVPFRGGRFVTRDGLSGVVAEGGADWQTLRADGVFEIDAHYVLRADSGTTIEVQSRGLRKLSAAVAQRIARGEPVDASEYYFRTHIRLATADPTLGWMNDLIAVSTGERRRDTVHIHVHEVC